MIPFIIIGCFIFFVGVLLGYFIGSYTRIPTFLEIDSATHNSFVSTKSEILPPRKRVFESELEKKIDETLKMGRDLMASLPMKRQCQNCKFSKISDTHYSGQCLYPVKNVPHVMINSRVFFNIDQSDKWTFSCNVFEPKEN